MTKDNVLGWAKDTYLNGVPPSPMQTPPPPPLLPIRTLDPALSLHTYPRGIR